MHLIGAKHIISTAKGSRANFFVFVKSVMFIVETPSQKINARCCSLLLSGRIHVYGHAHTSEEAIVFEFNNTLLIWPWFVTYKLIEDYSESAKTRYLYSYAMSASLFNKEQVKKYAMQVYQVLDSNMQITTLKMYPDSNTAWNMMVAKHPIILNNSVTGSTYRIVKTRKMKQSYKESRSKVRRLIDLITNFEIYLYDRNAITRLYAESAVIRQESYSDFINSLDIDFVMGRCGVVPLNVHKLITLDHSLIAFFYMIVEEYATYNQTLKINKSFYSEAEIMIGDRNKPSFRIADISPMYDLLVMRHKKVHEITKYFYIQLFFSRLYVSGGIYKNLNVFVHFIGDIEIMLHHLRNTKKQYAEDLVLNEILRSTNTMSRFRPESSEIHLHVIYRKNNSRLKLLYPR